MIPNIKTATQPIAEIFVAMNRGMEQAKLNFYIGKEEGRSLIQGIASSHPDLWPQRPPVTFSASQAFGRGVGITSEVYNLSFRPGRNNQNNQGCIAMPVPIEVPSAVRPPGPEAPRLPA